MRKGYIEVYPKFIIKSSKDLMIRGGDFYAIWDENAGLWSTDEETAINLIDEELDIYAKTLEDTGERIKVLHMWDSESGMIDNWHKYVQKQMRDHYMPLDEKLIFSNTETRKDDYASKKLDYPLVEGPTDCYDELMSTLYSPEEREKLEWAIGSIVSGDSRKLQKFIVLYGAPGSGKSTVLNIVQELFKGYYSVFDARALGSSSNSFALEAFKSNPLIAIQHDGDLSRIEDNTRLNSVVSHETMMVNEKFRSAYSNKFNCFLFMGTNKPVKITDSKSGILRRLIDVTPSGNKLDGVTYRRLVKGIKFELGGIAWHCLQVYTANPGLYDNYIPVSMLGASNDFYNFVLDSYDVFKREDGVSLKIAWEMYKNYCDDAKVGYPLNKRLFKEELKSYFRNFEERSIDADSGGRIRNWYSGFISDKFESSIDEPKPSIVSKETTEQIGWLEFGINESLFDCIGADYPAQYANENGTPLRKWDNVNTTLKDIDTHMLHYVRVPENHIVIDFDLKDANGNKSFALNAKAASEWPKTYAELSKGGSGIHLHYIYDGDVKRLERLYSEDIEIKVFTGNSALRRRLTKCTMDQIAPINSGLPIKEITKMLNEKAVKSEQGLRRLIQRNLAKDIMPGTKPSMDFIKKILDDAYNSDLKYDISDMKGAIYAFATCSTHHKEYCIDIASQLKYKSDEPSENVEFSNDTPIVIFDVEVFPNLFIICWKKYGPENKVIRLINPSPKAVEELTHFRLIGFNNRKYDNHILYARMIGYDNMQLFEKSKAIIDAKGDDKLSAMFGEAYNLSYTDIYDFASAANKKSLKKWEIELGIDHVELGFPWDQPVPEDKWDIVASYCENDVLATEAVFDHLQGDWTARKMLAALAGMTVNDTTNNLTTRIIFGSNRHPQLVYTDFSTGRQYPELEGPKYLNHFPGYFYKKMDDGKIHNFYKDEDVGKGGYVYANPGMYDRVITFDVASQHPHSIIALNYFGEYTPRFKELLDARVAIKHKDYDKAKIMLGGMLAPYLDDPSNAKSVSNALKTALNSAYGLTSAGFNNAMRDPRNVNNIVALRGALFMVNLKHEVQDRGFTVVHIKTDSIKVANPTQEIFDFIMDYGKQYGYTFEIEHIFEKICLVNDAVYVAKLAPDDPESPGEWTATGAEFQHPYVFKTLFSHEKVEFKDLCETKSTNAALYLDMNEALVEGEHDYQFIGRVSSFLPIKPGKGGGLLYVGKDGKYNSATGTKGYRWMEAETVKTLHKEDDIDMSYYIKMANDAIDHINQFGEFDNFYEKD
jgi:hypothetical protein